MSKINVVTHDGTFHPDDVAAIAILSLTMPPSEISITRTRNVKEIAAADIRVDVGGMYDPSTGNFDHHQKGFNETHPAPSVKYLEGPKKASTGLIWDHYGKNMIEMVLSSFHLDYTESIILSIWEIVRKTFIVCVDIADNNQYGQFPIGSGPYKVPSVIQYIVMHNPTWLEEDKRDELFFKAVEFTKTFLIRQVLKSYAIEIAKPKLKHAVDNNLDMKGVLVLDEYLPWMNIFHSLSDEDKQKVNLVIFPSSVNNQWMVQSPNIYVKRTDRPGTISVLKTPIPEKVRGLSSSEIQDMINLVGISFVHTQGFMAATVNKDAAIEFAHWVVNNQTI